MRAPTVIVTGASRGVGAATAVALGARGFNVVVNYREKQSRAEKICDQVREAGGSAIAVRADLTDPNGPQRLLDITIAQFGQVDAVILNASGGLERGADPGYAMLLNHDAQLRMAVASAAAMTQGNRQLRGRGQIVFVTSHQAHFSAVLDVPAGYEPIAASKLAGENALRQRFADSPTSLTVVSGDMLEGSIVVRLLERREPEAVASRRLASPLPTVSEFAAAIAAAVRESAQASGVGPTIYVGGDDLVAAGLRAQRPSH